MILSKYGRRAALATLLAATAGCAAPAPTTQTAAVPNAGDEGFSAQAASSMPAPMDVSKLPSRLTADQLVKVPLDRVVQATGDSDGDRAIQADGDEDRTIQQRRGSWGGRRGSWGGRWGGRRWGYGGWGGYALYSYPYYYPYYYDAGYYYPYTSYAYPYYYPYYYNTGYYYPYSYWGYGGYGRYGGRRGGTGRRGGGGRGR